MGVRAWGVPGLEGWGRGVGALGRRVERMAASRLETIKGLEPGALLHVPLEGEDG